MSKAKLISVVTGTALVVGVLSFAGAMWMAQGSIDDSNTAYLNTLQMNYDLQGTITDLKGQNQNLTDDVSESRLDSCVITAHNFNADEVMIKESAQQVSPDYQRLLMAKEQADSSTMASFCSDFTPEEVAAQAQVIYGNH